MTSWLEAGCLSSASRRVEPAVNMVDFHVLVCVQCRTFQVLQVTKSAKWKCKMCGLKQSVMKVYGQGSGADCRRHVQKLNSFRGQISETAEEHHLMSAMQTPVDPDFISPDNVISKQQETVKGSRWSNFLDEPDDEVEESLLKDDENNGAVLPAADWAECQGTRNTWRKRRAERNNRFSRLPGKISKNLYENVSMSNGSDGESRSAQCNETRTCFSVNHAFGSSSSCSLFPSKTFAANTPPVSSLTIEEDLGNRMNSPDQFCDRQKAPGSNSADPSFGYPSKMTHGHNRIHRDLSENVSVNVLGAKKEKIKQNKTAGSCNLSKSTVSSKWDAFLETEQHDDDDDDDVTSCEYTDNNDIITDSKLQAENNRNLSVGEGHLVPELQSVGNTQKHSSVHRPRVSDLHNSLQSKSGDWLQKSKLSDWLKENKNSDWLKESKHSDWLKENKNSDWLKESKQSDWLRDSVIERTTNSNSTYPAAISSSSRCKERGTFDLGLEIFDEDLQL